MKVVQLLGLKMSGKSNFHSQRKPLYFHGIVLLLLLHLQIVNISATALLVWAQMPCIFHVSQRGHKTVSACSGTMQTEFQLKYKSNFPVLISQSHSVYLQCILLGQDGKLVWRPTFHPHFTFLDGTLCPNVSLLIIPDLSLCQPAEFMRSGQKYKQSCFLDGAGALRVHWRFGG